MFTPGHTLHNALLEVRDHSKYLGVTTQSNLPWDKHIQEKCAKAHQTLGLVQCNIKTSNRSIQEQALYKSLVQPQGYAHQYGLFGLQNTKTR